MSKVCSERIVLRSRLVAVYLDDGEVVEGEIVDGLEFLHVPQHLSDREIVGVDDPERGHVDKVVLEVFQVKSFDVESREEVMVLVVVHLQLEYLEVERQ